MSSRAWTIPAILQRQVGERPDAIALIDGDRRVRYVELERQSTRVAAAIAASGVTAGGRVACLDHDSARLFAVIFGIAKAGAVTVGLNWRLGVPEIAFQLADAEVELLFVGSQFAATAQQAALSCPRLRAIVLLDPPDEPIAGMLNYNSWVAAGTAAPDVVVDREDVAVQLYTSGTTGKPKGVMLAHRSFVAVVESMRAAGDGWIGWQPEDVSLLAIPSFHIGGMWWAMTGFNAGACNVVVPTFSGWRVLRDIQQHRVTRACMVPAMLQVCMSEPDCAETDFSSMRTIVYGGSPDSAVELAAGDADVWL